MIVSANITNRLPFGSSMSVSSDAVVFYLIPGALGMLSELACFWTFLGIKSNSNLYTYLRAYSVNDFLVCGTIFCQFFYTGFPNSMSEAITIFSSFISLPLLFSCYLNSTFLDIAILLDRISVFNTRVKRWIKIISPYPLIILLAVISILLNIPYFFLISVESIEIKVTNGSELTIWYRGLSSLATTDTGIALIMFIVVINNAITMTAQISLNIRSVFYIRKHFKEKKAMVSVTQSQSDKYQSADIKTSLMVTILCVISFIEHILLMACSVGLFFLNNQKSIAFLRKLTLAFFGWRRFIDCFLYLKFNRLFRKQFVARISVFLLCRARRSN